MVEQEDIEIPEFQGNRHARYRGANERATVPGYNPENRMNLAELDEVDINNERQYFIHHNTAFPDISINPNEEEDAVRIKFFGCNSIYITDGITQLLIDPFFTRPEANMDKPSNRRLQIRSDPRIVEATLDHAQIQSVDAILMTHAHWDHALDIAEVWHALHPPDSDYPKIYGCDSIYHVAQGGDVPDSYIEHHVRGRIFNIRNSREGRSEGGFKVCFIRGRHTFLPTRGSQRASEGSITQRLPSTNFETARVDDYKEGEISDILIEHRHGLILIKGSANFEPGLLDRFLTDISSRSSADYNRFIDVLILGCAGFNTLGWGSRQLITGFLRPSAVDEDSELYNNFWDNVISPTKPYLLLFSHWDEFTEGRDNLLDKPPKWMYSAYECKDLFEGELRGRRIHTDRRVRDQGRAGIEHFRHYKTRFIPFWEEITILPIHERDSEGNPRRRTSVFHLPDEPDGTLVR